MIDEIKIGNDLVAYGCGLIGVVPRSLLGETEENNDNPQSG
jgi:hypothetical protein